jgi:hypothetical protein
VRNYNHLYTEVTHRVVRDSGYLRTQLQPQRASDNIRHLTYRDKYNEYLFYTIIISIFRLMIASSTLTTDNLCRARKISVLRKPHPPLITITRHLRLDCNLNHQLLVAPKLLLPFAGTVSPSVAPSLSRPRGLSRNYYSRQVEHRSTRRAYTTLQHFLGLHGRAGLDSNGRRVQRNPGVGGIVRDFVAS